MKLRVATLPFAAALSLSIAAPAYSADNAISLGAGVHPLGSAVPVIQYERAFANSWSVGARALRLDYDYDDSPYTETGKGSGAEVIVNYYFLGRALEGPSVGLGLGYFNVDWSWRELNLRGQGKTKGMEASASFGWKFALGSSMYIEPGVQVGNFFGTAKDSTGTRESDLGVYGAAMVKFGLRF